MNILHRQLYKTKWHNPKSAKKTLEDLIKRKKRIRMEEKNEDRQKVI